MKKAIKKLGLFWTFVIVLILLLLGVIAYNSFNNYSLAKQDDECSVDSDCVPATCCHTSSCVPLDKAPECEGIFCTQICAPNTLDCGQGSCACIKGKCAVGFTPVAGKRGL